MSERRRIAARGGVTRSYLVRHGVTDENTQGRSVGRLDVGLSEPGRAQAGALARRARGLGIVGVRCSSLKRALETGRIVADMLAVPLVREERLREMALGPWEGLTEEEIRRGWPAEYRCWRTSPTELRLEGHEGLRATQERAVRAVEEILCGGACTLCVTHLSVLRVVAAHYEGRALETFADITPGHGELYEIERVAGRTTWRALPSGAEGVA